MPEGTEEMSEIASAIRVGANAFIDYEYKVLYTVVAIVAVLLAVVTTWHAAIALLIGGIHLRARGVIRMRIPLASIATVAVLTLIFSRGEGNAFQWMLFEIFGGGLFLGAFFMATDYVTSPNTPKGEVIFGIGAGLLVVFIRYFGGYPEGVCYSILVMNICVWLIDKATMPARFGVTKEMRQAEKAAAKAAKKAGKEGAEA